MSAGEPKTKNEQGPDADMAGLREAAQRLIDKHELYGLWRLPNEFRDIKRAIAATEAPAFINDPDGGSFYRRNPDYQGEPIVERVATEAPEGLVGHRIDRPHDCFAMNCKDLGPEVEQLRAALSGAAQDLEEQRGTINVERLARALDDPGVFDSLLTPEIAHDLAVEIARAYRDERP